MSGRSENIFVRVRALAPVGRRMPQRIHAHVSIAVLALLLERALGAYVASPAGPAEAHPADRI